MAIHRHPFAMNAGYSLNSTQKGEVRCQSVKLAFAADEEPTEGDSIYLCKLPALHVPVDCILASDDLEDGAGLVFDVGIVDTKQDPSDTTDVDALIDGATIGQAGGIQRLNNIAGLQIAPVNYDRYVSLLWLVDAAGTFAAGDIIFTLLTRNKQDDAYEVGLLPTPD